MNCKYIKKVLGYDYNAKGQLVVNKPQAKMVRRIYREFLEGKTVDEIARIFKRENVKNWDGQSNWIPSTLDSMLRNEKYMGDVILQKSYTSDFLSKKRVINDGKLQKYYIKSDHDPIIDKEMWNVVQQELERRSKFCVDHHTNAYAQMPEINPLSSKVICGECGHLYSRVKYTDRYGKLTKKVAMRIHK
ncbi:MAG: recombinase family protein [Lachnospiraceae bacterium]|nr:recombinase family protein [Lachnospiraceae bacterium]